jgi:hypothetical protein
MWAAMKALDVSRQTVLQRVKRGQLRAYTSSVDVNLDYESKCRRPPPDLFAPLSSSMEAL